MMLVLPLRTPRAPLVLLWQFAFSLQSLSRSGPVARRLAIRVAFWPLLLALRIIAKT